MILLFSLTVAVMFGAGSYLMLKRDLIRVICGMILIGNAANLFIMAAGLRRGAAPVLPTDRVMSDSLVQAMTLTAIVISFGVATLVLSLVYRVYDAHHSVDLMRLRNADARQSELEETSEGPAFQSTDADEVDEPEFVREAEEARA